jgi:hypothetical protein
MERLNMEQEQLLYLTKYPESEFPPRAIVYASLSLLSTGRINDREDSNGFYNLNDALAFLRSKENKDKTKCLLRKMGLNCITTISHLSLKQGQKKELRGNK